MQAQMTEEQIKKVGRLREILPRVPEEVIQGMALGGDPFVNLILTLGDYDIVAKVETVDGICAAGYREGDEIVWDAFPFFLRDDPDGCSHCGRIPVGERVGDIWFAILGGADPETLQQRVECLDPGPQGQGMGHVEVEIRLELK